MYSGDMSESGRPVGLVLDRKAVDRCVGGFGEGSKEKGRTM